MFTINPATNDIELTKGDTLRASVSPLKYKNGDSYVPTEGDSIRFALKKRYTDDAPLIRKSIDITDLQLELVPSDTKNLNVGTYVYDIELTYHDGAVDTFISAKLRLTEEVD